MALREADKPSPNRGYAKRTPNLEASDNVCFRAYSPNVGEQVFSDVRPLAADYALCRSSARLSVLMGVR
jgi:hypothetical protein